MMNLTYKGVLKLKGTWLYREGEGLCKVLSATKNKIRLSNGSTVMTIIFFETHQHKYRLATEQEVREVMEERYRGFLEDNQDIIQAMANSPKYRGWGGNAYAMAHDDMIKQEGELIDLEYVNLDNFKTYE